MRVSASVVKPKLPTARNIASERSYGQRERSRSAEELYTTRTAGCIVMPTQKKICGKEVSCSPGKKPGSRASLHLSHYQESTILLDSRIYRFGRFASHALNGVTLPYAASPPDSGHSGNCLARGQFLFFRAARPWSDRICVRRLKAHSIRGVLLLSRHRSFRMSRSALYIGPAAEHVEPAWRRIDVGQRRIV